MASTRVLLNERPGRRICHACGLRQGDPLSPMLFTVVMVVLNNMISTADRHGVLLPLPSPTIRNQASWFDDHLVIFLSLAATDLRCMRAIM